MNFLSAVRARIEALVERVLEVWRAEPVLVTTFVTVALNAAVAFGAPLTTEEKTAVVAVVTALGAIIARSRVSPVPA